MQTESHGSVHAHNEVEDVLDTLQKHFAIVNVYVEFTFDSVVNHNASPNVVVIILVIPVGLERDWNTIPSVRVDVTKSITATTDDSFGQNMWLLLQVYVVSIWVVKCSHREGR